MCVWCVVVMIKLNFKHHTGRTKLKTQSSGSIITSSTKKREFLFEYTYTQIDLKIAVQRTAVSRHDVFCDYHDPVRKAPNKRSEEWTQRNTKATYHPRICIFTPRRNFESQTYLGNNEDAETTATHTYNRSPDCNMSKIKHTCPRPPQEKAQQESLCLRKRVIIVTAFIIIVQRTYSRIRPRGSLVDVVVCECSGFCMWLFRGRGKKRERERERRGIERKDIQM